MSDLVSLCLSVLAYKMGTSTGPLTEWWIIAWQIVGTCHGHDHGDHCHHFCFFPGLFVQGLGDTEVNQSYSLR